MPTKKEKEAVKEIEKALEEVEQEEAENAEEETEETQVEENEDVQEVDSEEPLTEEQISEKDSMISKVKEMEEKLKAYDELGDNVAVKYEQLQQQLKEKEELAELAAKSAELEARLERLDRKALVDVMVAKGQLPSDLKDWADSLSFDQLKLFAEHAPKKKTILDQKNNGAPENLDSEIEKWKKDQMRSRIL